jgi:hypothetical protein
VAKGSSLVCYRSSSKMGMAQKRQMGAFSRHRRSTSSKNVWRSDGPWSAQEKATDTRAYRVLSSATLDAPGHRSTSREHAQARMSPA